MTETIRDICRGLHVIVSIIACEASGCSQLCARIVMERQRGSRIRRVRERSDKVCRKQCSKFHCSAQLHSSLLLSCVSWSRGRQSSSCCSSNRSFSAGNQLPSVRVSLVRSA